MQPTMKLSILNLLSFLAFGATGFQLSFTAIPDQDETTLQARADAVTAYLQSYINVTCGVDVAVVYKPVSDYESAVNALLDGTADFGWYGGLTGVQAGLRSPPAEYLAQRVEDKQFTSVFIQGPGFDLSAEGIHGANGRPMALGSESSTSGNLMPSYFMSEADPEVVPASIVYTGSHDATVDAVADGSVEVGALNSVVWENRVAANTTGGTSVFFTTPEYADYLWVSGSAISEDWEMSLAEIAPLGSRVWPEECVNVHSLLTDSFLAATADEPLGAALLDTYSTSGYVSIEPHEYDPIFESGCELGLIEKQFCDDPPPNDLGEGTDGGMVDEEPEEEQGGGLGEEEKDMMDTNTGFTTEAYSAAFIVGTVAFNIIGL
jgi:phosphonate transport system substrate-binding protein